MGDFTVQFGRLVAYRGESAEVVVPDNVTVIGRRAFHFSNVTSVTLPDSVTEIEQEAFMYAKLTHIQFGHGIKKIGADAFLCDLDKKEYLYPKLPIAVFSKGDQRRALYHFVHNAKAGNYNAAAAGTGTLYPFCAPGGGENSCAPLQNFPHHLHTNRRILPMGKSQISARGAPKSACSVVTSKCLFPPRTTPLNCPRPQKV